MYNKIASIILNSGQAAGFTDVFVAQPDALKEGLAGKVFILAEIGGRKTECRRVFDFLITALNENYYNDEKILLRDKIEGLKIENIFEAALTKINKNFTDFLLNEKIKINPATTNLTLGVVYENKLHFSNFGRNRALLIFGHNQEYEIINVEANAAEVTVNHEETETVADKTPKLFSSVISGEIPVNSYFIFASETMLEYLSGQEMISIITKLPPITASEQIKNALTKINTYVPFFGLIIKNTVGLAAAEMREEKKEIAPAQSTHTSISSLNYIEQKTERMLAPAGLINFSQIFKKAKQTIKNWQPKESPAKRKSFKPEEETPSLTSDLGTIKSLNLARSNSFLVKEKIFFKKKSSRLSQGFKRTFSILAALFNSHLWANFGANFKAWIKDLNQKKRLWFVVLGATVFILVVSIFLTSWNHRRQVAQTNFENSVAAIQEKEDLIDSRLLIPNFYDNEGSKTILVDAQALLNSLPRESKEEQETYQRLADKLKTQEEKIQKIFRVTAPEKVNDLVGLGINNLSFAAGAIYGGAGNVIYKLTPGAAGAPKTDVTGATALSNPQFSAKDNLLYYWDGGQIVQFNLKNNAISLIKNDGPNQAGIASFKIFSTNSSTNLYALAKNNNQIYVYKKGANGFTAKTDWLKAPADLGTASDLYVDGSIYVLKDDGTVLKFHLNKSDPKYSALALSPLLTGANKLIVGAKNIYLFSPSAKRLVVLDKTTGALIGQYIIESLTQPRDFTVDDSSQVAYILDNDSIYKISLTQ
jgi:hypothetical protein